MRPLFNPKILHQLSQLTTLVTRNYGNIVLQSRVALDTRLTSGTWYATHKWHLITHHKWHLIHSSQVTLDMQPTSGTWNTTHKWHLIPSSQVPLDIQPTSGTWYATHKWHLGYTSRVALSAFVLQVLLGHASCTPTKKQFHTIKKPVAPRKRNYKYIEWLNWGAVFRNKCPVFCTPTLHSSIISDLCFAIQSRTEYCFRRWASECLLCWSVRQFWSGFYSPDGTPSRHFVVDYEWATEMVSCRARIFVPHLD